MYIAAQICAVRQLEYTHSSACFVDNAALCPLDYGASTARFSWRTPHRFRSSISPRCHDEATVASRNRHFSNRVARGTIVWSYRMDGGDNHSADSGIRDSQE